MPFLQISDLMPADLWFRYLQAVLKNAGLRAKIAENSIVYKSIRSKTTSG